jgi:hypothetical protein
MEMVITDGPLHPCITTWPCLLHSLVKQMPGAAAEVLSCQNTIDNLMAIIATQPQQGTPQRNTRTNTSDSLIETARECAIEVLCRTLAFAQDSDRSSDAKRALGSVPDAARRKSVSVLLDRVHRSATTPAARKTSLELLQLLSSLDDLCVNAAMQYSVSSPRPTRTSPGQTNSGQIVSSPTASTPASDSPGRAGSGAFGVRQVVRGAVGQKMLDEPYFTFMDLLCNEVFEYPHWRV